MKLSECTLGYAGTLARDGEFDTMNYCTTDVQVPFLTFLGKQNFIHKMNPHVTCVLCAPALAELLPDSVQGVFICDEPKYTFHRIYSDYSQTLVQPDIPTVIGSDCDIAPEAYISPVGVVIGDHVTIEPLACIRQGVTIGDYCHIGSQTVIGGTSFTYAKSQSGDTCKLADLGRVVLEDHVEILACSHVAQSVWPDEETRLGSHVKIDILCHIAHGVHVGRDTFIAGGAVIGGNTMIGEDSWIGPHATVANRVHIGSGARVNIGSLVVLDVKDGETVYGHTARKYIS